MSEVPVVIRNNICKWNILSYDEKDWCNVFGERTLRFRKGYKTYNQSPYWEQLCEEVNISMKEFFEISKTEDENDFWLYFDYKYMKDVFPANSKLLEEVKWANFGLCHLSGKDSTIWIGNKGAHTPCHMDTYGCNLVAQILGRKLWILVPPEETDSMSPVRVPYEESSVYSSYNFYTPNLNITKIRNACKIILNPGEVLFIPKHWWHYVENMELAVSINVWIPEESDHESRLEEALVRYYVSNICQTLTEEDAKQLLNPNECELLSSPFKQEGLSLFLSNLKQDHEDRAGSCDQLYKFKDFVRKNGEGIQTFLTCEIKKYIETKCHQFNYCPQYTSLRQSRDFKDKFSLPRSLINSYCHPEIVTLVKNRLLESKEF